jgi:ubiquinone/menaquinone biosynthesis C-methylase UbiE
LDIWEEWLLEGRHHGSSAQERQTGLQFIETARQAVEAELRLQPGQTVLEVGCGAGDWLPRLLAATPGGGVVALDGSAGLVERARQSLETRVPAADAARVRWLCQDLRAPLPSDLRVHAACGRSVLQYMGTDLPAVLRTLHGALLPGGRIGFFEATPLDDPAPVPRAMPERLRRKLEANWWALPWRMGVADYWRALRDSPFRQVRMQHSQQISLLDATPELIAGVQATRPVAGEPPLGETLLRGLSPAEAEEARECFSRAEAIGVAVSWCLLAAEA